MGIVFVITAVFLPFLLSIIFKVVFKENESEKLNLNLIMFFVKIVLLLMGMIYIIKVLTLQKFLQSGAVGFYIFCFFPSIAGLLISMFIDPKTIDKQTVNLINLATQITVYIIAITLIFVFSPTLRLRFKKTCKENFPLILLVISLGFVAMFGLSFLFNKLDQLINGEGIPQNQESLNKMKNTSVGTVLLFFLTVTTAPFIEELACRHGIFSLSGNKWLAFFTSVIYFAGIHVESAGDWNKILGYMGASLVLTLTFLYVRGNVTYVIFLHMLYNAFGFIIVLT